MARRFSFRKDGSDAARHFDVAKNTVAKVDGELRAMWDAEIEKKVAP